VGRAPATEAVKEAARETITRLNADPTFKAANSERTKRRWVEYRAQKAALSAQPGNDNGGGAAFSETPHRQQRTRGIKLARTLAHE